MQLLKHEMEEALRESEEKFRNIFESANDAMIYLDRSGRILDVNRKAVEVFGGSKRELLGKHFTRVGVFSFREIPTLLRNFANIHAGKKATLNVSIKNKKGREILLECSASLMKTDDKIAGIMVIARDVTERKTAEEKIRESEERLRQLIEYAPDAIYINDLNGNFVDGNKQAEKMIGYKKEELIGKNMLEVGLLPEKYVPKALEAREKTLHGQRFGPEEFELIRKDGSTVTVEISSFPVKRERKFEVINIARDITERKKAEEKIRESEEKYRVLVESAADAIFTLDEAGNFLSANKEAAKTIGKTPEEVVGKNMYDLFPKDIANFQMRGVKTVFQIGSPILADETLTQTKFGLRWYSTTLIPVKDSNGKIIHVMGIARDITERKRAEEKLRLFSQSVDSSIDGMAIGNPEGKIIYVNEAFVRMFGYSREELIGKAITSLHPEDQIPKLEEALKATMEGGWTGELVGKRKNGELFPIAISSSRVVDDEGKINAHMASHRDITERKQMEKKLEEYSQQLEELVTKRTKQLNEAQEQLIKSERLAAIGELATMVGHDLRNPLQAIENATYYLNNELPRILPSILLSQKTVDMLQIINDSVNYADKIIKDLHDFSATKKPTLKKIHINTIVKETLSQVKTPENVELTTELAHLPKTKADKDMIKRAFLNLTTNAIQAMKNGGTLKISTKKTGNMIEVSFKDTGTGISKENMKKIFTPFFTTKAKGMGMGLSICKKFIESHGGSITVESKEGKGTTFTVKLPIQQ